MKKLILFIMVSSGSICFAAFKTDALNVTSSSVTVNGVSYIFPSSGGSAGQCLISDGGNPPTLAFGSCSGAGLTRYILLEDGIPAPAAAVSYVLLEDNSFFLLEGGTKLLLQQ